MSDPRARAMHLSLGASVLMLVGKCTAAWISGSDAILSDAAESVVHILATGFAAFSLWYARQPPDRQHPYGHGKIAYVSIGAEGAVIGSAGLGILYLAGRSLLHGPELREIGVGLLIMGVMAAVNLALGLYLIRTGKRHQARVLVANGHHVLTDMWTSLGVIAGVTLVLLTDLPWLDPLTALAAGLYILYNAASLLREAWNGLMERVEEADAANLLAIFQQAQDAGLIQGYHQVRFRQINDALWIEAHLLFPRASTLREAHAQASRLEAQLRDAFPERRVFTSTHLEPAPGPAGQHDDPGVAPEVFTPPDADAP